MNITQTPSLWKRIQIAASVFRFGFQRKGISTKKAPFIWPASRIGKPQWQMTDFRTYVEKGYNINSLIYDAITFKARCISQVRLRVYKGTEDDPELQPITHPLYQLVKRPNEFQSFTAFQKLLDIYYNISGNAYVLLDRGGDDGIPKAMYTLRPDRVWIIPKGAKQILGYWYVPEGKEIKDGTPILPRDVMHIKLPNPGDPFEGMGYGLSPMSPLAQSGDVDNMVTGFLNRFFDSGANINTYITFDEALDEDILEETKERYMEIYGGSDKWHEIAVLDSGGKIQRFGYSFDEMNFEAIDQRNEGRILGPLGVPLTLIPTQSGMSAATYNNKQSDRTMFWQDTMIAEMKDFEDEYQYYLQSDDGGWVAFDFSKVYALQKNIPELVEAWTKLFERGVPATDAAHTVGLSLPELEHGDIPYMKFGLLPMGTQPGRPQRLLDNDIPEAVEDDDDDEKAEDKVSEWTPEQKEMFWKENDAISQAFEPSYAQGATDALEHDMKSILAFLGKANQDSLDRKATVNWDNILLDVQAYLVTKGNEYWKSVFTPLFSNMIQTQAKRWMDSAGLYNEHLDCPGQVQASDWFNNYTLTFAQPINDTTLKGVTSIIVQAQKDGWSIPTTQKHLTTYFEQSLHGNLTPDEFTWFTDRMPQHRTELIARTETIRSSNWSQQELFRCWKVRRREWLATLDDRVRDSHAYANNQVRNIDEPFDIAGVPMMFPGDPSAPVSEFANCRCTIIPIMN